MSTQVFFIRHLFVGGVLSLFFGVPGFFLGLFLSVFSQVLVRFLDRSTSVFERFDEKGFDLNSETMNKDLMFRLFLDVTFEVLGHVAKSKGSVTEDDIYLAETLMDRMSLDEQKRRAAQASFNTGKNPHYPLKQRLQTLYRHYQAEPSLLTFFVETQVDGVCVDGYIHPKELEILGVIAKELKLNIEQLRQYIHAAQAAAFFKKRNQYQEQRRNQQYTYSQQRRSNHHAHNNAQTESPESSDLANAYKALGLSPNAPDAQIKQTYRRLMNAHHPDKLVSRGLPPEMLDIAKQKTQEIQSAYELIKKTRGFK